MAILNTKTGYFGFTIDTTGNTTDINGNTNTCIFAINYPLQPNDVDFNISNGAEDWAAQMGDGTIVPLLEPTIIFQNRDNSIVQFTLEKSYPANSPCFLVFRSDSAKMGITDSLGKRPFEVNSVCGYFAFTVEANKSTFENGLTTTLEATIPYPYQAGEVELTLSDDPSHWGVRMGDGSIIPLSNPNVLFSNQDNGVVRFTMDTPYPTNSPGVLVYRNAGATIELHSIDGEDRFVAVEDVIGMPEEITCNIPFNLKDLQILPFNATSQDIVWEVTAGPAEIVGKTLVITGAENVTLRCSIFNGLGGGNSYTKTFTVKGIKNVITIITHPVSNLQLTLNKTKDILTINATSKMSSSVRYQWYKNKSNTVSGGTEIVGETSSSFQVPNDIGGHTYYYCKVSADGADDVYSNICDVYVAVEINSIYVSNNPRELQISQTFTLKIGVDPESADIPPVMWSSSDLAVATVEKETGLVTALNDGNVTFTAITYDNKHITSCDVTVAPYVSVTNILGLLTEMDTETNVTLTGTVEPSNATVKNINWSMVDASNTGATVNGNIIRAATPGNIKVRATVLKGISLNQDYTRDFYVTVNKKFLPVNDVQLNLPAKITAGDSIVLSSTVIPTDATNNNVTYSIVSPGTTGATLNGNLLTTTNAGTVTILATVKNGASKTSDYTKSINITIAEKFVPVQSFINYPTNFEKIDEPLQLTAEVYPANATMKTITSYKIKSSQLGDKLTLNNENQLIIDYEHVTWWKENPNPADPNFSDQWLPNITDPIVIEITVKDGTAEGQDFVRDISIDITLPGSPNVFIPVTDVEITLPTINRAHRPILMDYVKVKPFNATGRVVMTDLVRPDDPEGLGGVGATFYPVHEDFSYWDELFHIDFNPDYDWYKEMYYTYLFEDGTVKFTYAVPNGVQVSSAAEGDGIWYGSDLITFLPAYMKVDHISNIPRVIYANGEDDTYVLDPLCHTNIDVPITNTSMFDVDIPSYTDIKWRLSDKGDTKGVSITEDGIITIGPNNIGKTFKIKAKIENGLQEEYTWYDKDFENIPYEEEFEITIEEDPNIITVEEEPEKPPKDDEDDPKTDPKEEETDPDGEDSEEGEEEGEEEPGEEEPEEPEEPEVTECDPLLTITLKNKKEVSVKWFSQLTKLCNHKDERFRITIGGVSFVKSDITEVKFWNEETFLNEAPTSLRSFGCNFTSLTTISDIPDSITGDQCLMYFLEGCTNFNQDITIPNGVTGNECLHAFLKGCTKFNSDIVIPNKLTGNGAMKRFLSGCTTFNKKISIPTALTGNECLRRFLEQCGNFNQKITLPNTLTGERCLDHFLFNCTKFNQDISIPDDIKGKSNMRAFMRNTVSMTSTVTVSTKAAENCEVNGLTFGCFERGKPTYTSGVKIAGTGAEKFKQKCPSMNTTLPIRNIK